MYYRNKQKNLGSFLPKCTSRRCNVLIALRIAELLSLCFIYAFLTTSGTTGERFSFPFYFTLSYVSFIFIIAQRKLLWHSLFLCCCLYFIKFRWFHLISSHLFSSVVNAAITEISHWHRKSAAVYWLCLTFVCRNVCWCCINLVLQTYICLAYSYACLYVFVLFVLKNVTFYCCHDFMSESCWLSHLYDGLYVCMYICE